MSKDKWLFHYLLAEDGAQRPLHLSRVLDVHRPHVGLTDVDLSVRMLRGQLQTRDSRSEEETPETDPSTSAHACPSHLSQSGLAFEEVCVFAAFRRRELGVEEGAAVGDGLQWGGTLIGEGQTHEQLEKKGKQSSHHLTTLPTGFQFDLSLYFDQDVIRGIFLVCPISSDN